MSDHNLTPMQSFFLDAIKKSDQPLYPTYLAVIYYQSIGKRIRAASRDSFGQTCAAHRTCRHLSGLGLIREIREKTPGGYLVNKYASNDNFQF